MMPRTTPDRRPRRTTRCRRMDRVVDGPAAARILLLCVFVFGSTPTTPSTTNAPSSSWWMGVGVEAAHPTPPPTTTTTTVGSHNKNNDTDGDGRVSQKKNPSCKEEEDKSSEDLALQHEIPATTTTHSNKKKKSDSNANHPTEEEAKTCPANDRDDDDNAPTTTSTALHATTTTTTNNNNTNTNNSIGNNNNNNQQQPPPPNAFSFAASPESSTDRRPPPPATKIPAWAFLLVQWVQAAEETFALLRTTRIKDSEHYTRRNPGSVWSTGLVPAYALIVAVYLIATVVWRCNNKKKNNSISSRTTTASWLELFSGRVSSKREGKNTASSSSSSLQHQEHNNNRAMTSRSLEDLSATNTNATLLHSEEQHQHHQPIDLTGSYKLVQSDNVDAFLAAQGVPWALRRLAVTATPLHHLIHSASTLTIKIEAPGFVSQTVYPINGPVVETNIRGRIFRDVVRYYYADNTNATTPDATAALNNNNNGEHNNNNATINTTTMVSSPSNNNNKVEGIVTEKRAVAEGYVVTVIRRLSDCKSRIDLKCTVTFPNEPHKESIVSTQVFERIVSQ